MVTKDNLIEEINKLTPEQTEKVLSMNKVLDNDVFELASEFGFGVDKNVDKCLNVLMDCMNKVLYASADNTENKEGETEGVAVDVDGTDYIEEDVRAKISYKIKPNENAKSIYEIFSLKDLQQIYNGYLNEKTGTLSVNYELEGFNKVRASIKYDEAKEDYVVSAYSKPTDFKNPLYPYQVVNELVVKQITDEMWKLAKGEISPINIDKTININDADFEKEVEKVATIEKPKKKKEKEVVVGKFEPSKRDIELSSVEDTIRMYQSKSGLSKEEIQAFVFYRQCLGIPMNGWEDYFLSSHCDEKIAEEDRFYIGEEKGQLVYANNNDMVSLCDDNDKKINYIKGQFLGILIKNKEKFCFVIDRDFRINVFAESDITLVENNHWWSKEEIQSMVGISLYARDFVVPRSILKENFFNPISITENDFEEKVILDTKTKTYLAYNSGFDGGEKYFYPIDAPQVHIKPSNLFNVVDETSKMFVFGMGYDVDLTSMFYNNNGEGKFTAIRGGMKKKKITIDGKEVDEPEKDFKGKDNKEYGLLVLMDRLVPNYDTKKSNATKITDFVKGFYGKDGKLYVIPYMAIREEIIPLPFFESTILMPKNEFLKGNIRKLLKETKNERVVSYTEKLSKYEIQQLKDEANEKGEIFDETQTTREVTKTLPPFEEKYNEVFGNSLGTKQKDLLEKEISENVLTFDITADLNSGLRPYVSLNSSLAKTEAFISKIYGETIYEISQKRGSYFPEVEKVRAWYADERGLKGRAREDVPRIINPFSLSETSKVTLLSAFAVYLSNVPNIEISSTTTKFQIMKYYIASIFYNYKLSNGKDASEEQKEAFANELSSAIEEGERLFALFLSTCLEKEEIEKINEKFNEEESYSSSNLYNYAPFGYIANKNVFSSNFTLNNAQIEGLKYLTQNGSGLLMHDVGFGKTLCAIHSIACKLTSGEVKRPFVCVPNAVYVNWAKEMFGGWKDDSNKTYFEPIINTTYESGVFSGTNVNILLLGNCSTQSLGSVDGGIYSKNFTLYNSHWKKIKQYTIDEINSGKIPENTIILSTHSALTNKITLSDDVREAVVQKSVKLIKRNENVASSTISDMLGSKKVDSVLLDKIKADFIVVDEAHNQKSLLKGVGLMSGATQQSAIALKMFNLTTYFSTMYGNAVCFLTATPFTNKTAEIFAMMMFVNEKRVIYDIPTNTEKKFERMFVSTRLERKVNMDLTFEMEWIVGKFNNRRILRNIVSQFINNNFDATTANVFRPSKINYPNLKVGTFIAESGLQKTMRKLIQEKILKCETDKSPYVIEYNVYSKAKSGKSKKDLIPVGDIEEMKKNEKVFNSHFFSWYLMYEELKIDEEKQADFNNWLSSYDRSFEVKEDLIIEKKNVGTIDEAWVVYKLENEKSKDDNGKDVSDVWLYLNVNPTLTAMTMLNVLSSCPYYVTPNLKGYSLCFEKVFDEIKSLTNLNNVSLEEFIGNCPKFDYVTNCIKSVRNYHERNRNEIIKNTKEKLLLDGKLSAEDIKKKLEKYPNMSGQVIYITYGMEALDKKIDTSDWNEDTKELYGNGKNVLQLLQQYIIEQCGFTNEIKDEISGKTYKEVEIISGSINNEEDDRIAIQDLFNSGKIQVIIGSSAIKEGVNLQKRSTALYCCSLDWNPTDFQQLEGRIWRQGNEHQFVRIVTPLVQNSNDSFIYQKLGEKMARISSIFDKAKSNTTDLSFALDENELKFQILSDVDELSRLETYSRRSKLRSYCLPLISSFKNYFGSKIEGTNKKEEGVLTSVEDEKRFRLIIVDFLKTAKDYLSNIVTNYKECIREQAQKEIEDFRNDLLLDYQKDQIANIKTNLESRTVKRPKLNEKGEKILGEDKKPIFEESLVSGLVDLKKFENFVEKPKEYISKIESILEYVEKNDSFIPKDMLPSERIFNFLEYTYSEREIGQLSMTAEIKITDYNDDGEEVVKTKDIPRYADVQLDAELSKSSFSKEFDYHFEMIVNSDGKYIRNIRNLYSNYEYIISGINKLIKKGSLDKNYNKEDIERQANTIFVQLFGTPKSIVDFGGSEYISTIKGVLINLLEEGERNAPNTNIMVSKINEFISSPSVTKYHEDEDGEDDSNKRLDSFFFDNRYETTAEESPLYKLSTLSTRQSQQEIRAFIEDVLRDRNKNSRNARGVAQLFAKYNYIISEKFGNEKTGILPKYVSNDMAILGVENSRKYVALGETDYSSTKIKLLKIRDFIPFEQYKKFSVNIAEYITEINNIYYNVYAMFSSKESGENCLRYVSKSGKTGFYVLSNAYGEIVDEVAFMSSIDEDLYDENFTTTIYSTKLFTISNGVESIDDTIQSRGDFAKEDSYLIDGKFVTSVKFDGDYLYEKETKEIEEQERLEKEKIEKVRNNLKSIKDFLIDKGINEVVYDTQVAERITIENVRSTLENLLKYTDASISEKIASYNTDGTFLTNDIFIGSQISNEYDDIRDTLYDIMHILNLCIGFDDTQERAEKEQLRNALIEKERLRKEREAEVLREKEKAFAEQEKEVKTQGGSKKEDEAYLYELELKTKSAIAVMTMNRNKMLLLKKQKEGKK